MPGSLDRTHYASALSIFLAAITLYGLTMPVSISLEDAGLFQMVCRMDGLAHPPGYPLFSLLCKPLLPLIDTLTSNPVVSGNFLSAAFAGLAAVTFYYCCCELTRDSLLASVASLAWLLSPALWSQAVTFDVYTLAALNLMACFWLLLKFATSGETRWWLAAAFAYGLALSNHWPLMILSTPALLMLSLQQKQRLRKMAKEPLLLVATSALFLLGLTPYLSLLSATEPAISIAGGIHSIDDFLKHVSRHDYAQATTATLKDNLRYSWWLTKYTFGQAGYLGIPLVALGLLESFRRLPASTAWVLVLLWTGTTLLLGWLLDFSYNTLGKAYFAPYTIIAMAVPALWFALGLTRILQILGRRIQLLNSIRYRTAIAVVILLAVALDNYPEHDRSHVMIVDSFTRLAFKSLPADTILMLSADNEIGPFGYLHHVEGLRPDIRLMSWEDTVFATRLASPHEPRDQKQQRQREYFAGSNRPVVSISPFIRPGHDYGAYVIAAGKDSKYLTDEWSNWLTYALSLYEARLLQHPHDDAYLQDRLKDFARLLVPYEGRDTATRQLAERLERTFPGQVVALERSVQHASKDNLLQQIISIESDLPESATPDLAGRFYKLAAEVHMQEPSDKKLTIDYLKASIDAYPVSTNPAICTLSRLDTNVTQLRRRFPKHPCLDST